MNWKKGLLLITTMILLCLVRTGHAKTSVCMWLTGLNGSNEADQQTMPIDAIKWYATGGSEYCFFLPKDADLSKLRLWFSGTEQMAADEKAIENGSGAAILQEEGSTVFSSGRTKFSVKIMRSSDIPALYLTTESGSLNQIHRSKEYEEAGSLLFVDADGSIAYDGKLEHIKMRGNTSTTFKKKNYQIKLSVSTDLLHMGKEKKWILTSNSRDKSLLRNKVSFAMAQYAGLVYTPENEFVDVYINNEYMGCYLFSEKIEIDGDRVDIDELEKQTEEANDQQLSSYAFTGSKTTAKGRYKAYAIPNDPADITGGYLFEYESYASRYKDEPSAYYTRHGKVVVSKSPEYASVAQMEYLASLVQGYENAIFAPDGIDPGTGRHYSSFMDFDSLVSKYLLEEVVKNYDGNTSSQFFYKPVDEDSTVAFAGPVWDYDSAFGSYARPGNIEVLDPDGFWINTTNNSWWTAVYQHHDFQEAVVDKFHQSYAHAMRILIGKEVDENGDLKSIDEYAQAIADSAAMNFTRWTIVKNSSSVAQTGDTWEENLSFLKAFISSRLDWLSGQWVEK